MQRLPTVKRFMNSRAHFRWETPLALELVKPFPSPREPEVKLHVPLIHIANCAGFTNLLSRQLGHSLIR